MKSWQKLLNPILTNNFKSGLLTYKNQLISFQKRWEKYMENAIVPEIEYTATDAIVTQKTVRAYTFYCNSLSGCDSSHSKYKNGDGTKQNPWRSFYYAMREMFKIYQCFFGKYSCDCNLKDKYFQLKVSGSIDYDEGRFVQYYYESGGVSDPSYVNNCIGFQRILQEFRMIVSPWNQPYINFITHYKFEQSWIDKHYYCLPQGCIYHNINIEGCRVSVGNSIINNAEIVLKQFKYYSDQYSQQTLYGNHSVFINIHASPRYSFQKDEHFIYQCFEFSSNSVYINANVQAVDIDIYQSKMYNCSVKITDHVSHWYNKTHSFVLYLPTLYELYNCTFTFDVSLSCESVEGTCYDSEGRGYTCMKSVGSVFCLFDDYFYYTQYDQQSEGIKCYYDINRKSDYTVIYNTSIPNPVCIQCPDYYKDEVSTRNHCKCDIIIK